MLGGVPNTNYIRNVPRLPNSSVNYWGEQSNWTHSYTPLRAHSHRQHSPTWATTQEFLVFIRHPEPKLKRCYSEPQLKEYHVLNPYLEPQLKGYVPSHNSRDTFRATTQGAPASWPLRYHRSLVDHANQTSKIQFCCSNIAWHYSWGVRHFLLSNRLEVVMSANLCLHKCLNFGDLIYFLRLRDDFSCIIYYWIFLNLIMQLEFNWDP